MAEMAAAAAAQHLGALHQQAVVGVGDDRSGKGPVEARPTGPAVELGRGIEQRLIAAGAAELPAAMLLVEGARKRPLGPGLPQDLVTLLAKLATPLRRCLHDSEAALRDRSTACHKICGRAADETGEQMPPR